MKQVILTADAGVRKTGEVLTVDDKSATSLVERKVGEYYDPERHKAIARSAPRRGNVSAVQVVEDDVPVVPPKGDASEHEQGDDGGDPPEPSTSDSLPALRARAIEAGIVTEEEAKALTKAQLVDKLTS